MKLSPSTIVLVPLLVSLIFIAACSGDEETVEKDSAIDQAVKKVADRGVDYIQTPIEKAKAVKEIEEARHGSLEELDEQEVQGQ